MGGQLPRSDVFWILGGLGLLGAVAYLATHNQGNVIQPTDAVTAAAPASNAGVSTNTLAYDTTALPDPLTSIPSSAYGGSMTAPGTYVEMPSGTTIPFMPGIQYSIGSVIHYADGSVQIL